MTDEQNICRFSLKLKDDGFKTARKEKGELSSIHNRRVAESPNSPNAQVVVALRTRVTMTVRFLLVVGELVRVQLLDFVGSQAIDHSGVELVHLLTLDNLVAEVGHRTTS